MFLNYIWLLIFLYMLDIVSPVMPGSVTNSSILNVKPGMCLDTVICKLGRPLKVTCFKRIHSERCSIPDRMLEMEVFQNTNIRKSLGAVLSRNLYCCPSNDKESDPGYSITLVYTHRKMLISAPMLWVHLDTAFRVIDIFSKEYAHGLFGDEEGIYCYSARGNLGLYEGPYAKTLKWMNKEKFDRYFK